MALSGSALAALIKQKIEALSNFPTAGQSPVVADDRALLALAEAIVEHIQMDATVLPGTFSNTGGPVTGVGSVV